MPNASPSPQFLFVTCQVGAEKALKAEVTLRWPDFRASFARPGFLTFKLPDNLFLPPDFDLESVFARAYGLSLGKIKSTEDATEPNPTDVWSLLGDQNVSRIHVWQRDRCEAGEHSFEPSITPEAIKIYEAIRQACPNPEKLSAGNHCLEGARRGETIADCIIVEPGEWWIGVHKCRSIPSRWPGGMIHLQPAADVVSRAWYKMEEALAWSRLPIESGARCAEIGSAPGGSSQALLDRGMEVIGIDPAVMDSRVSSNPRFRHIRRRTMQTPRRAFRKVRWLMADMNVAPSFTLDAVEDIVRHPEVNIRGMLLTLKLPEWSLAAELPNYLARVRSWGFNEVHARQLQYDRREICVSALMRPFQRKPAAHRRREKSN
jgi:23S rRNA (cytidine2498-2'-O)-methyltransferase